MSLYQLLVVKIKDWKGGRNGVEMNCGDFSITYLSSNGASIYVHAIYLGKKLSYN